MKFRAGIPALLVFAACTENDAVGPKKCVDVPASPSAPAWILDREESQPNSLGGIWGTSSGDVFSVGSGVVLRLHDGVWSHETIPMSVTSVQLGAIWGASLLDIFAVGDAGTILHYDGTRWTTQLAGTPSDLHGVWGSSATDVYAVGRNGTVVHYDGASWRAETTGTTATLSGIWGSAANDIFVVGSGTVLHYDGLSWSTQFSDAQLFLGAVWGTSGTDVFAVGRGTILHYDGLAWTSQATLSAVDFTDVWGRSGSDVFAVGVISIVYGVVYHYDGTSWSSVPGPPQVPLGVWGRPGELIVVGSRVPLNLVGPYRGVIAQYDGSQWTEYPWPNLRGVWASSGRNAVAVGGGGTILHYDGAAWHVDSSGTDKVLEDVWGAAPNDVFAVGGGVSFSNGVPSSFSGVILHYDGNSWRTQLLPSDDVRAVWGRSGKDVYAVETHGGLLHYDGSTWTQAVSGTSTPLAGAFGIWVHSANDIYAVGAEDTVRHYDGARWNAQPIDWPPGPVAHWWSGVWGSSADNLFAVGTRSLCTHFACFLAIVARNCGGGSWTAEVLQEPGLEAVGGSTAGDVYAVGDSGTILRRDGQSWVPQTVLTQATLTDVWGATDGTVFVVGGGAIIRGTR